VALIGDNDNDVRLLYCSLAMYRWNRVRRHGQACHLQKFSPLHWNFSFG
jgi:formate dehydrogenase maturation protein FdhE